MLSTQERSSLNAVVEALEKAAETCDVDSTRLLITHMADRTADYLATRERLAVTA